MQGESAPAEPLPEELAATGDLDVDGAGLETAPTLSQDALDAVDDLAGRIRERHTD